MFFSVKYSCLIQGVKYRPSVCYRLTGDVDKAVREMAGSSEPTARIYQDEVRFVSGVARPVRKTTPLQRPRPTPEASLSSSPSALGGSFGEDGASKSGSRRKRKEF
jgi:hypothetical protein